MRVSTLKKIRRLAVRAYLIYSIAADVLILIGIIYLIAGG
jgi:hypothetical protein